ncbi:MAG: NGG1p interacting factor NIF3, partial [Gammaproteobacteria bacterium]
EWRVEILCSAETISAAVEALKAAHPYEEPAFEAYALSRYH